MNDYFGIFKNLHDLNISNMKSMDLYSSYYAGVYDLMTSHSQYDLSLYLEQASLSQGPVLELCCGSGRLGLSLVKSGVDLVGIDLSRDMLDLYSEKLAKEPLASREKTTLIEGDVLKFKIKKKFGLIILPATTISLFSKEQLVDLFEVAYRHLKKGGRFVFDARIPPRMIDLVSKSEIDSLVLDHGKVKEFILFQEELHKQKSRDVIAKVNFYSERASAKKVDRFLGCSTKYLHSNKTILDAIGKTEFKKVPIRLPSLLKNVPLSFYCFQRNS